MKCTTLLALATLAMFVTTARADEPAPLVVHRKVTVDGLSIFYREAGPPDAPAVLLLHGFPSSSFMYRNLIPPLARRYRVGAPIGLRMALADPERVTALIVQSGNA